MTRPTCLALDGSVADAPAALLHAFAGYEEALLHNDIDAMTAYFFDSAAVLRFGIADMQRDSRELRAWREAQPPLPPGRVLRDIRLVMVAAGVAVATTLFGTPGRDRTGRQTQVWVDGGGHWRIASAHVSEI